MIQENILKKQRFVAIIFFLSFNCFSQTASVDTATIKTQKKEFNKNPSGLNVAEYRINEYQQSHSTGWGLGIEYFSAF